MHEEKSYHNLLLPILPCESEIQDSDPIPEYETVKENIRKKHNGLR
jgi:hypothetical protein